MPGRDARPPGSARTSSPFLPRSAACVTVSHIPRAQALEGRAGWKRHRPAGRVLSVMSRSTAQSTGGLPDRAPAPGAGPGLQWLRTGAGAGGVGGSSGEPCGVSVKLLYRLPAVHSESQTSAPSRISILAAYFPRKMLPFSAPLTEPRPKTSPAASSQERDREKIQLSTISF